MSMLNNMYRLLTADREKMPLPRPEVRREDVMNKKLKIPGCLLHGLDLADHTAGKKIFFSLLQMLISGPCGT